MDTKKRALKKKINYTARGVLFYNVILVGVTLLFAVGYGVYVALNPSCAGDAGTMQKNSGKKSGKLCRCLEYCRRGGRAFISWNTA